MDVISNHPAQRSNCVTITSEQGLTLATGPAGPEVTPLYRVRGAAVLSDGRIVVLNAGSHQLLFFTPAGSLQSVVGRQGRGPGEFRNPTWLGRSGDTLFVWDGGLGRLSTFDGVGDLLATRQVGFEGGSAVSAAIRGRFGDGSFLVIPGPLVFVSGSETGPTRFDEAYERYDPVSDRTTYLASGQSIEMVFGDEGGHSLPFGKRGFAVAYADAVLVADNGNPALHFYALDGQLRKVVTWAHQALAVTGRDRAAFAEHVAQSDRAAPADGPFAKERPRFSSIHVDRLGWIWVLTYRAEWEAPGIWLVFDDNGVLRCETPTPSRFGVLEIGRDYVLGLQRNDLGEESVLRFALQRVGEGEAR